MNTVEAAIELRDRAVQVAINFAGRVISESDGTYDLLITVVQDTMREWAKAAIEEEREGCAEVAEKAIGCTRREIAAQIRARSSNDG